MNNLYKRYIFWKFKRQAKSKYRVLQRNENTYEVQIYQNVGIGTNVSIMKWTPLLIDKLKRTSTEDDYKKVCDELRQSYYNKLVNEFTASEKKKELRKKYPKVIY